jgi:glycosyltransferase involved in cell wall biosynthesis
LGVFIERTIGTPSGVRAAAVRTGGPRVAVLLWEDARHPGAISGMPWNMRVSLQASGCEIVPVIVGRSGSAPVVGPAEVLARSNRVRRVVRAAGRWVEDTAVDLSRFRHLHRARRDAGRVDRLLRSASVDAVFGPCMSGPLAWLESDLPVVYASDATASLLVTTYDRYRTRGRGWQEAVVELESRALRRSDRVALASDRTVASAIHDHGADPAKVSVVPLGANVRPEARGPRTEPSPPRRGELRLLLSAADPERKQLDLCVDIVRGLRRRGTRATLHYIGPEREACRAPEVAWAGALRLGDPRDAATHRRLLQDCHLAILPSLAEMYGIAPIESAAFGRPAVVSDAGGLPSVVRDGETGRVVPLGTALEGWIEAVEEVCGCPDRYRAFARAALARYESELNWEVWGERVRGLIEDAIVHAA